MPHFHHRPTLLLRPEEARDSNGPITPYTEGAVHVVDGRYGRAWRLEESTTNWVLNPRAATDLTNITGVDATISRVTNRPNLGWTAVQVVTGGVAHAGPRFTCLDNVNVAGGTAITASAWVEGTPGLVINMTLEFYHTDATVDYGSGVNYTIPASGYGRATITRTVTAGKTLKRCVVDPICPTAATYYTSKVQCEQKPYVTSFVDNTLGSGYTVNGNGTITRDLPLIQFPVGTLANPYEGTVLVRYKKIVDPTPNTSNNNYIFYINQLGVAGHDGFGISQQNMKQRVRFSSGTTINETPLANREPIVLNQWDTAIVRWKGNQWEQRLSNSTPQTFTRATPVGNFQGDVRLSLGNPANSANADIESALLYDVYLEDHEVDNLLNMEGSWTWANIQPYESPMPSLVQATSYRMVPQMFLADKNNTLGAEITEYVEKGNVEYNPDRTIKFTLKATMSDDIVRPYRDFLAPFLTIEYDDGHSVTSQLGLYATVPPNETVHMQHQDVEVDGRDLTWLLSLDVFDNGYSVAAGTNVVTAVRTIINGAGFTRINIQDTGKTIGVARSWKPGTTKLAVINDLLTGAGYYSLTCGKDGSFVSIPYVSIVNPTVVVEYDTTKPSYVKIVRDVKKDTTQDRIANKVVVVKDNGNEAPIVVTKINNNPNSPTSTTTLGMTIAKVVTDSNVVDAASANVIATRHLEEASQQYNKISINTWPDVERGINDVYRLNIVNSLGETVADGLWRCRGWKIGFRPSDGPMQHDLSNIDTPPMEV